MKRLSLLTLFVFVVTISAGFSSFAGDKKKHHKKYDRDHHHSKRFYHAVKKLDLSDEQKSQLDELKNQWKEKKDGLKSTIKEEKKRLHEIKSQDPVDREQLNQQIEALYMAKAEYKKAKYGFKFSVMDLLNDEQMKTLKSMKKKHHDKKKHKDGDKEKSKKE